MALTENIRRLRKQKHWSQSELAEKVGSHLTHINRIETGKHNPSLDVLKKLADTFEVTLDQLISNDEGHYQEIKIEDKNLAERVKLLNSLDLEDKNAVIRVIDAMLTKKKILHLINEDSGMGKNP